MTSVLSVSLLPGLEGPNTVPGIEPGSAVRQASTWTATPSPRPDPSCLIPEKEVTGPRPSRSQHCSTLFSRAQGPSPKLGHSNPQSGRGGPPSPGPRHAAPTCSISKEPRAAPAAPRSVLMLTQPLLWDPRGFHGGRARCLCCVPESVRQQTLARLRFHSGQLQETPMCRVPGRPCPAPRRAQQSRSRRRSSLATPPRGRASCPLGSLPSRVHLFWGDWVYVVLRIYSWLCPLWISARGARGNHIRTPGIKQGVGCGQGKCPAHCTTSLAPGEAS